MLRPDVLSIAAIAFVGLGSWSQAVAQQTCTVEFSEVGEHSFTVPNVDEIVVDAFGASGGDTVPEVNPPGPGGLGAAVLNAVLAVTPDETLTIRVGGRGEDTRAVSGSGPGAEGGFNGGGDGGDKTMGSGTAHSGAGGGGASDVLRGAERLVIAGGGGGGAHSGQGGHGGEDGTDGTSDGPNPAGPGLAGGNGGGGGSGTEGGDDGETSDPISGVGGRGGDGNDAGSGGGGGLRGGGGDGTLGDGAGGGGGSSFGPSGTTFDTGANQGDGRVEIRYQCFADITIAKTGSGPDPLVAGETVEYSFEVTNTGNVPLTDVTVTDPLDGLSPIDCPESSLAPGESMTCTATYVVTADDVEAGVIENTATATGQPDPPDPPDQPLEPPTDEDDAIVPPTQNPGIEIVKSGSGPDPLVLGATVEYTFEVTNTGNVTLTDVTVTDPLDGLSPIDCPESSLTAGESMTCTASYEVTQTDVDAGVIENTATVTGQPPSGAPPTDESTTSVPPAGPVPALPPLAFVLLLALLATATLWTLRRARV